MAPRGQLSRTDVRKIVRDLTIAAAVAALTAIGTELGRLAADPKNNAALFGALAAMAVAVANGIRRWLTNTPDKPTSDPPSVI